MLMRGELPRQPFVGDIGLGDDQQPGRVLVDAVDDARPRDAADPRQAAAAMVEQGVDQRPVAIAGGRMDDQPGRLVDDQQMLVLEDDGERDVLRLVVRRLRLGDRQLERLVALDLGRRVANRLAVASGRRCGSAPSAARATASARPRPARGRAASRRGPAPSVTSNDLLPPGHLTTIWVCSEAVQCPAQRLALVKLDAASTPDDERRRSCQPAVLAPVPRPDVAGRGAQQRHRADGRRAGPGDAREVPRTARRKRPGVAPTS